MILLFLLSSVTVMYAGQTWEEEIPIRQLVRDKEYEKVHEILDKREKAATVPLTLDIAKTGYIRLIRLTLDLSPRENAFYPIYSTALVKSPQLLHVVRYICNRT